MWGINSGAVDGRSSETQSHSVDMNSDVARMYRLWVRTKVGLVSKAKAVPPHVMEALGGRGCIAPAQS
jgi:hypothetical protein